MHARWVKKVDPKVARVHICGNLAWHLYKDVTNLNDGDPVKKILAEKMLEQGCLLGLILTDVDIKKVTTCKKTVTF